MSDRNYEIIEAQHENIPSLATIVPRSFHPVNPYIRNCLPDTATLRTWWSRKFEEEIRRKDSHVLIAHDGSTKQVVGVLCLRLMGAEERGSGLFTVDDLTPDHDRDAYLPMIEGMTQHRERMMMGKPHFMIELFGVDDAYKGRRLGQRLLSRACEISDEVGHDMFVQANATAQPFYGKQGFEIKGSEVMPGEAKYTEFMLVRPCLRR